MYVQVINLERNKDRLVRVAQELDRRGIKWERLEGVDGGLIDRSQRPDIFYGTEFTVRHNFLSKATYVGQLTNGELGCALSHLRAYHNILLSGENGGIIMEDDFMASTDVPAVVENALKVKPKADIISCYGVLKSGLRQAFWARSYKIPGTNKRITRVGIPGFDWFFNRRRRKGAAVCYWISKQACARLLEIGYPVKFEADVLTGMVAFNKLRYYLITPSLGYCLEERDSDFKSTIGLHGGCRFE